MFTLIKCTFLVATKLQTCAGVKVWQRAILCYSFPCQALHITTCCIPAKHQSCQSSITHHLKSSSYLIVTMQSEHDNIWPYSLLLFIIPYLRQQNNSISNTILNIFMLNKVNHCFSNIFCEISSKFCEYEKFAFIFVNDSATDCLEKLTSKMICYRRCK